MTTEWTYNGEPFAEEIKPYEGFVYMITNLINGRRYLGKKHFWTRRKEKGKTRKVTRESDWENYYGSSDLLKADIASMGKENFKREILHLCVYKKEMTFLEEKEQWDHNVLMSDDWYNTSIGGRYFVADRRILFRDYPKKLTHSDKWKELASERMKGENNVAKRPEVRAKISEKKKGENHHQFGKPISDEHREKMHQAAHAAVRKRVLHIESGVEYPSMKEYRESTGKTVFRFYKELEMGLITYVQSS